MRTVGICILVVIAGMAGSLWARWKSAKLLKHQRDALITQKTELDELFKELATRKEYYANLLQESQRWFSMLLLISNWMGLQYTDLVKQLKDIDYKALYDVPGVPELFDRIEAVMAQGPIKRPAEKMKEQQVRGYTDDTGKVIDFPLPQQHELRRPVVPPKDRILKPV